MTTRRDGQMGIAAAFGRVTTPGANKRLRPDPNVHDVVTPKPPPPSNEKIAPKRKRDAVDLVTPKPPPSSNEKKAAKRKRDAERKRAYRAARSQEKKDADRVRNAELERQRCAARTQEKKDADLESQRQKRAARTQEKKDADRERHAELQRERRAAGWDFSKCRQAQVTCMGVGKYERAARACSLC